ncbi:putative disease resistance protein At4g19050 [Quercus lobata]|uniref:putative disease resistance protein At4g19050 n=1 Tax=Quercus lobata TaxID=97700 RepID=UPI001244F38A|nr:putative disease resistance protein At4g19050 [Quercus lobata]
MSDQSPKQTMSQPSIEKTMSEQSPKQSKSEQADQTVRNKITEVLLPKDNASSPASALATEEDIVHDLMDEGVSTIVLTGEAGVGKTWMASEISKRAMQVGICFGTIWVFPNPEDLSFPITGDLKPHILSIAHQLSVLSTVEEWEDHSTVIDENITVNDEKKATDETGKSGDDTTFEDDEKEASEDSLKKKMSDKLEKMRSDKLEKLRFDLIQEVKNDMTDVLEKMRSDELEKKKLLSAELDKIGLDELEKMMVDMVRINELLSAEQPGKMISGIEKTRYENMISEFEKIISEKNERLSALLGKISEKEKMKSEVSEKVKSEIPEKGKEKTKSEVSEKEKEKVQEMNYFKYIQLLPQSDRVVFKFLITTRRKVTEPETGSNKKVFKIERLSDDDSSSLLGKKVKEKDQGHPDFETLYKEIAKKSKGALPADIKTLYEEIAKKSEGLPAIILMVAAALTHIEEHDFDSRVWLLKGALDEPESTLLGYVYDMLACTDMALMNCCWQSRQLFHKFGGINYEELIACWILEGYIDVNDQFDKAYEEGHCVLMKLIDRGILKLRVDGLVTMEGLALTVPDEHCHGCRTSSLGLATVPDDHCHGREISRLGLASILEYGKELGIGRVAPGEGMIKTPYGPKSWNKVSTLLIDGSRFSGEVLDTMFLQPMKNLQVLAIFNPRFRSLPSFLFENTDLRLLVLRGCDQLDNIDQIKNHEDLIVLEISGASSLQKIPDDFFLKMKQLESLNLSAVPFQSLPSSLSKLTKLRRLILQKCSELKTLPYLKEIPPNQKLKEIPPNQRLANLEVLDLSGSTSLKKITDKCLNLEKLQMLDLSQTQINHLPILKELKTLTRLILKNCKSITRLSKFDSLASLHNLGLSGSTTLKQIHHDDSFKNKGGLKVLDLSESGIDSLPSSFTNLSTLESFDLSGVSNLVKIRENIFAGMTCLRSLNLSNTKIEELPPSISNLKNLRQLLLSNCTLKTLPKTGGLTRLEKLDLSNASSLDKFEDGSFDHLTNLRYLNFSNTQITSLPSIAKLVKLRQLLLQNCVHLSELPSLDALEQLEELDLSVKETENKSSQSSQEPLAEPLKENEAKSPVKETEKKPSESSGEPSAPVKATEKKPSESSGEPSAEHLKETEAAKSPVKETEKKSSESSREPSKETEAKLSVEETEKKSSGSSGEPLAEPLKEVEARFLEKMVHLRLLNLSGTKLKIKIPLMSNLTSLTNLTELCLGGCKLSDTVPSLEMYTKLNVLDLSKTEIQSLPSLENLTNLRGLKLRGCKKLQQLPDLKSFKDLESLDLQETGVKEFPYWISELTHLKHLDLPDLNDLKTLDWERIKNLPEELNWDHCGIFKFNEERPCMSLSGRERF